MRPRAPDRMSTERASRQAGESCLEPVIGFVSRVLVPGGLLTAVLYYFGYVREQALFSHFGIDLGIVGFSTTDYLVRSTSTVFFPLATVLLLGVVAVAGHYLLVHLLPRMDDRWRQAAWNDPRRDGLGPARRRGGRPPATRRSRHRPARRSDSVGRWRAPAGVHRGDGPASTKPCRSGC